MKLINQSIIVLIVLLLGLTKVYGATITVTNTNDSGLGSLRQATIDAGISDIIIFAPALANSTVVLSSEITISQSITIDGGVNNITIDGNSSVRFFNASGTGDFNLLNLKMVNGNSGGDGGGLYSNGLTLNVENCELRGCSGGDGGAVKVFGGSHSFKNVQFVGNSTTGFGGGFHSLFASAIFENVTFVGNIANRGGAAYFRGGTSLTNCTVSGNRAITEGGAFHIYGNTNVGFYNSIIWNNSSAGSTTNFNAFYSIENGTTVDMELTNSVLENSGGSVSWNGIYGIDNGGNLDLDPKFNSMVSATLAPTLTGNYELTSVSPCYNTGSNTFISLSTDVKQNPRIIYGIVDMGSYEFCETIATISPVVCSSYTLPSGTSTHTVTGVYYDTLSNYLGCDSVITINLTVNNSFGTENVTACNAFTSPSGTYNWTTSGVYNDTLPNALSCDSIITVNLTISNSAVGTDVQEHCNSYTWIDGNTYTSSNSSATHNIVNGAVNGCDSLVTLDLTINYTATGTDTQDHCDTYTWIDGNTYTVSNNSAMHTLIGGASTGCDSIVTLNLTINNSTSGTDTQIHCNTYTWIDGNTYTTSNNVATHNLVGGAVNGCDSLVSLDLTINNTVYGSDVQVACDTYNWVDGNTYTTSNNTAIHTIVGGAVTGCDSVITLSLTINNSTTGIDTQVHCDSYVWIDGNTYTTSNYTATHNIIGGSSNGCDSLVTLNLTIGNETTSSINTVVCNSYISPSGLTINNSGIYNDTIPNVVGCDSVITINLTVNVESFEEITDTACFRYELPSGIWKEVSGTYIDTIPNSTGCDSIITINLTIDKVDVELEKTSTTLTSNAQDATFQWLFCNSYSIEVGQIQNSITPKFDGSYAVEISQNGCIDTTECNVITVVNEIPTAFSPNNDGVNDFLILDIKTIPNTVTIFNRWGDVVVIFNNYNDTDIVWDGNNLDGVPLIGTFFYVIEGDEPMSGWVQVVR
jgi:gliding motility-associated-like protein